MLGASDDLLKATQMAHKMVRNYGMSDNLGLQYRFDDDESEQDKFNITEEIDNILKLRINQVKPISQLYFMSIADVLIYQVHIN